MEYLILYVEKSDITDQAHHWGSHSEPLFQELVTNPSHSWLGLFFWTKHSFGGLWARQSCAQSMPETAPWLAGVSSLLEWPSREWLQLHFQVTAKLPRETESPDGARVRPVFLHRRPGFILRQAFPCREPAFCPLLLRSPMVVSGKCVCVYIYEIFVTKMYEFEVYNELWLKVPFSHKYFSRK